MRPTLPLFLCMLVVLVGTVTSSAGAPRTEEHAYGPGHFFGSRCEPLVLTVGSGGLCFESLPGEFFVRIELDDRLPVDVQWHAGFADGGFLHSFCDREAGFVIPNGIPRTIVVWPGYGTSPTECVTSTTGTIRVTFS